MSGRTLTVHAETHVNGKKEQEVAQHSHSDDVDRTLLERGEEDVLEAKENALERNKERKNVIAGRYIRGYVGGPEGTKPWNLHLAGLCIERLRTTTMGKNKKNADLTQGSI